MAGERQDSDIAWVIVDGRRVRCRVVPPARDGQSRSAIHLPLLLLHGLGCSADAWGPTLRCLRQRGVAQPVYAPDMPGYGRSPGPREALGIDALADWAARLLDALGIDRAHTAGNSMGCQVALALAHRHPARVGKLVLLGPTTGTRVVPFWRYVIGLLADSFVERLRYNVTLLRMTLEMGLRRYAATVRKMMEDDSFARLPAVKAPCLIVRGVRDAIVSDRIARTIAAALPDGTFIRIPGSAHAVQFNRPDRFVRVALAFLRRVEPEIGPRRGGPEAERAQSGFLC